MHAWWSVEDWHGWMRRAEIWCMVHGCLRALHDGARMYGTVVSDYMLVIALAS